MTGTAWIRESGNFSGPIALTNSHSVGIAHAGIVAWTHRHHPDLTRGWLLPVAAETWDGYLNDINGHHVTEDAVIAALESACSGPLEEGSVGGGTGMNCYEYKGGSGTSSRVVEYAGTAYTVGAFLQANFGARHELTLGGVWLGEALVDDNPISQWSPAPAGSGSCVAIVATDAPLIASQCAAMARRVSLGLARTGTAGSHFSGDLFLALSVANPGAITPGLSAFYGKGPERYDQLRFIPWGFLDPFYEAVVQSVEESVANALVANETMIGRNGHRSPGMPRETVRALMGSRIDS